MSVGLLPLRPRIARRARLRWDARSEKHLLVYPERGLLLNAVAARIVALADGSRTVDEIVDRLLAEFEGSLRARVERETAEFLLGLRDRGLLERDGSDGASPLHPDRGAHLPVPAPLSVLLEPGRA